MAPTTNINRMIALGYVVFDVHIYLECTVRKDCDMIPISPCLYCFNNNKNKTSTDNRLYSM